VEAGLWCFVPGKAIEEYIRLIRAIENHEMCGIPERISDILARLNKPSLKYFDSRYNEDFDLRDMKLFGVELLEILESPMNVTSNLTVTYKKEGASCFVTGCIFIEHCTEMSNPYSNRQALLIYLRNLVRANNCDIALRNLREWPGPRNNQPRPFLVSPIRKLKKQFCVFGDFISEVYEKEAVQESPTDWNECNMAVECTFSLICPKYVHPLWIEFQDMEGENRNRGNCLLERETELFSRTLGENYEFNLTIKLKHPSASENLIEVTERCITNCSGKQECLFHIRESNSTSTCQI
ncbi:hypothetical protein L9F63_007655, partial [Diploptera punctata]